MELLVARRGQPSELSREEAEQPSIPMEFANAGAAPGISNFPGPPPKSSESHEREASAANVACRPSSLSDAKCEDNP